MNTNPALIAIAAIWLLAMASFIRSLAEQYATPGRSWNSYELRRMTSFLPFLVSLLVFGAGLYIVFSYSYSSEDRGWGFAIVGSIIGYWLRGSIR